MAVSRQRPERGAKKSFAKWEANLDFPSVPRKKTKATSRPPQPACWALIPIDGLPIREKARKEYEKVLRDLDRARQELERFEKHDKPGFSQWCSRHFGALITELRETGQQLQTKRELLFEIESEALLSNSSYARAYERVLWQREHPDPEPDPQPEPEAKSVRENGGARDGEDPFAEFAGFFSDLGEEFDQEFDGLPPKGRPSGDSGEKQNGVARVKELYRAVVRRLHPDTQQDLTAQKLEWWHQAQAAYQGGDAEQLQVILTLCEIDDHGTTAKTSVSLLMLIIRQFKSSLRALKKQVSQCQRDPAWNFNNLHDRSSLSGRMERSLREDLFEMKRALGAINGQLESWARQAKTARRHPRRRGYRSPQPEFLF